MWNSCCGGEGVDACGIFLAKLSSLLLNSPQIGAMATRFRCTIRSIDTFFLKRGAAVAEIFPVANPVTTGVKMQNEFYNLIYTN